MLAVNLIGFAVRDVKPICGVTPMTDGREKGALGLLARGRCCADLRGDRPAKTAGLWNRALAADGVGPESASVPAGEDAPRLPPEGWGMI